VCEKLRKKESVEENPLATREVGEGGKILGGGGLKYDYSDDEKSEGERR